MYELKVKSSFSAAHHLLNYNGNCENQHGHNWQVEVFVMGGILDKSNLLIDFKVIKKELNNVLEILDHKDINMIDDFINVSPSSEILAKFIYTKMKEKIKEVTKVSVWETENACASYYE